METIFTYAERMGAEVSRLWASESNRLDALPDVALKTLETFSPDQALQLTRITEDIATTKQLPRQRAGGRSFGQPPLTLYNEPDGRFFIELYLWSETDMTIHDHPFTGAFSVLNGDCNNDTFTFNATAGDQSVQIGQLDLLSAETMHSGDSRGITNGTSFIHRNLHLSRPTITFIIRTLWDGGRGMIYEPGGLAIDPAVDKVELKQLEFLEGLLRLGANVQPWPYLEQLASEASTASMAYRLGNVYLRKTQRWDQLDEILQLVSPHFSGQLEQLRTIYLNGRLGFRGSAQRFRPV